VGGLCGGRSSLPRDFRRWTDQKDQKRDRVGHPVFRLSKRDGFELGMGLHAPRYEEFIQVDDGGHSLGQVMKFAGHRNSKTLVGYYLDDMSNADSVAAHLA